MQRRRRRRREKHEKKLIHFLNVISIFDECHSSCCFFSLFFFFLRRLVKNHYSADAFIQKFPVVFIFSPLLFFSSVSCKSTMIVSETFVPREKKIIQTPKICMQSNKHNTCVYFYIDK